MVSYFHNRALRMITRAFSRLSSSALFLICGCYRLQAALAEQLMGNVTLFKCMDCSLTSNSEQGEKAEGQGEEVSGRGQETSCPRGL